MFQLFTFTVTPSNETFVTDMNKLQAIVSDSHTKCQDSVHWQLLLGLTRRAGSTVERAHSIQTLNHRSDRAATIIGRTFIHILTAVAVALPT